MATAKRDVNNEVTAMAVTEDANLTPTNLIVDPITKALKVEVTFASLSASASVTGKIDVNREGVLYAVTDDANEDVVPIAVDANGYLEVQLT